MNNAAPIVGVQITGRAGRKEWIGLAILTLPVLLVSMDNTIMFLVIPSISADLRPGSAELLWITDIYGFLEAGLLITMGTLGDRIGRRKLLLIGGSGFALASILAAFAHTVLLLIVARALLGMAGACLLPSTLSLIRNLFHDRQQRTAALGIFTTCFSAGTMLGPLVGGVLLSNFGWGSVFFVAVPIMLLFLILAPVWLPEFKDPTAGSFDLASAGLSISAVLVGIYGIKQMAENGFSWLAIFYILSGLVLGVLFLRRQNHIRHPLIDTKLFDIDAFTVTLFAMLVSVFAWAGVYLFITQQLQLVIGMKPFHAGLWTITGAIGGLICCGSVPFLLRHFRRAQLMPAGLFIMGLCLIMIYFSGPTISLAELVITMVCLSGGCGITVTVAHDVIMATAKPQQAGAAASLAETFATFGGAFGIAVLGSIGTVIYRGKMLAEINHQIPSALVETAQNTLGGAVAVAAKVPTAARQHLLESANAAFDNSFTVVAGTAALFLMGMVVIVWQRLRKVPLDG